MYVIFTLGYHLYSFNNVVVVEQLIPPTVHIAMMNSASGQPMDRPLYKAFPNYDFAEL